MAGKYTVGLDFGTNSVRALIVKVADGEEIATQVWNYAHGEEGVILDSKNPHLARQHPKDYLDGIKACLTSALAEASSKGNFSAESVIGIGVDTTGSTPLPVDKTGEPLAVQPRFEDVPAACAWLWKDHSAHAEAEEITELAQRIRPQYLAKCGGKYSSEWFWSKILHCARSSQEVFLAAHSWVEIADWIPSVLCGTSRPDLLKRGICAAGHKAMFNTAWGGYPDPEFLSHLDERLVPVRHGLPSRVYTVADEAGRLTPEWATQLGLPAGIPVVIGAFDAHLGGVGSGIRPGTLVKIIGTSTCDMMTVPLDQELADIPGLCGIVPGSVLPDSYGLEAGQSAVGDIFNWFVQSLQSGADDEVSHELLTEEAEQLRPGQSGLLGLDWHNGNRTILVDQRLTGLLVGLTLRTTPAEIYRSLIESTAFGARVIMEDFEEHGVKVERVVNCGGVSAKNSLLLQIYADIMGRNMEISRSSQTCALGAATAAAVVAGSEAGGFATFGDAVEAMTAVQDKKFHPIAENVAVYHRLYSHYRKLHDQFGTKGHQENLFSLMKDLLTIRDEVRGP